MAQEKQGDPESNVELAPAVISNNIGAEYVRGVGKLEDRLLILLDLERIFGANELHNVNRVSVEAPAMAT